MFRVWWWVGEIEYCRVHGYPRPRFFDAHAQDDDSGNAAAATSAANARYRVWVVLGPERFELPTAYAGIKEGEEKMARKVLRHLRSRDVGESQEW